MFHGLTMVNFDGQTQNQMMVRPWSTMVDHGQPWSDGQTVAGACCKGPADNHFWLSMVRLMASFRGQFTGFSLGHLHTGWGRRQVHGDKALMGGTHKGGHKPYGGT